MEASNLEKLNRLYYNGVRQLENEYRVNSISNYLHITGHLLQYLTIFTSNIRGGKSKDWSEVNEDYIRARFFLKRYMRLINNFEAFRQKEILMQHGYFEHIENPTSLSDIEHYVKYAWENLTKSSELTIPP